MRVLWISAITIIIDQVVKTLVVRNMDPRDSHSIIGDWFKFTYVENPGMAFGIEFGPPALISIFSIAATILIMVYLFKVRGGYFPYTASLGLVLGGAIGNIIDRVFYGAIYYNAPLFRGRVVDFIHFDIGRVTVPDWVPLIGDKMFAFFPIWNVADMAIVAGVVGILVFQKKFHVGLIGNEHENSAEDSELDSLAATDTYLRKDSSDAASSSDATGEHSESTTASADRQRDSRDAPKDGKTE